MNRISTLSIIFVMLVYGHCWSTIINIPADYTTIQQGIDTSTGGDTVLVYPGTYVENINFNGHNVVLGSLFLTTGDTSYISTTVIDGDSAGSVIIFSNFENYSSVVMGFTIINGGGVQGGGIICDRASPIITHNLIMGNYGEYGGGIVCDGASPLITHNFIMENYGENGGGIYCNQAAPIISQNSITGNISSGIGCYQSQPKIMGNTFIGNLAELGGAIYCENSPDAVISDNYISRHFDISDGGGIYFNMSDATLIGNLITENLAGRGGGFFCQQSSPIIRGNTISRNLGEVGGGGIFLFQSDPTISNNIIAGNFSYSYGAGLTCKYSNPVFLNNTVTGNTADMGGGGIFNFYSVPVITNSIFWANNAPSWPEIFNYSGSSAITYSDIQGGWPGEGNVDIDPLFRDSYSYNGDFHLMSISCVDSVDSPCIDAGDPNILDSLLDCSWGLGGLRSDMGAYGGGDSAITAIFEDYIPAPARFTLMQNHPNPFNASTTVRFGIPEEGRISLVIYDLLGRKTAIIADDIFPAGDHLVPWNGKDMQGDDVSSGIYFYKFKGGGKTYIKTMTLIR